MPPKPHILIVDDETGIRESLASILTDEGYVAESAESAERAGPAEPLESRGLSWTSRFVLLGLAAVVIGVLGVTGSP